MMDDMITADDFRIRRTGSVFYVWQRGTGRSWERMCYPHGSRAAARAWIAEAVSAAALA